MREFIFRLVRKSNDNDRFVKIYDYYIIIVAIISITPLLFRTPSPIFKHIETVTVYLLFLDYILRWITHDYHVNKHSPWAFVMYPFTPLAIMDILGILPTIGLLPSSFMILRLLRLV
ncbi:MAG: ion transporter, partial [Coprobacillus sp.]